MIVTAFSLTDKANRARLFKKPFLVANVSPEVVLGMFFPTLNSANINFLDCKLRWRTYITKKALSTNRLVRLLDKKKFAAEVLDSDYKTFIVSIASLNSIMLLSFSPLNIYPFRRLWIAGLIAKKDSYKGLHQVCQLCGHILSKLVV